MEDSRNPHPVPLIKHTPIKVFVSILLIFFSLAAQAGDTFASHAHKQKIAESAGISCVSSVLPPILNLGKNKTKMIAAVTASFGAGAAAMAADIGEQYDNLK